jgi:hypothetical protein
MTNHDWWNSKKSVFIDEKEAFQYINDHSFYG